MSIVGVLAWSAIPLGSLAGEEIVTMTGNVALVYAGVGLITCVTPLVFSFTALGHEEEYLPAAGPAASGTELTTA